MLSQGSTVSREASERDKSKEIPTFKDNDFVAEGNKIYIGDQHKAELMQILRRDVEVSNYNIHLCCLSLLYFAGWVVVQ